MSCRSFRWLSATRRAAGRTSFLIGDLQRRIFQMSLSRLSSASRSRIRSVPDTSIPTYLDFQQQMRLLRYAIPTAHPRIRPATHVLTKHVTTLNFREPLALHANGS